MATLKVAKYGDQVLLVSRFSDEGEGRDWITQSPSRGDDHVLQERGRKQRRTSVELVFCDQPGRADYLDRWLAFRTLADGTTALLFTHPLHGAYLAVVQDLRGEVNMPERAVRASCVFVAGEPVQAVFPVGAGVTAAAGPEQVEVRAAQVDEDLAGVGLSSSTPASCFDRVTAWAEDEDPDARAISLEAASLADEIDAEVERLDLVTDLTRWPAYRSLITLRYSVAQAAAGVTSETSQVVGYTVQVTEPLRALCARLFGAGAAAERARQVQKLNGLRTPGLVPAGTVLSLPVPVSR